MNRQLLKEQAEEHHEFLMNLPEDLKEIVDKSIINTKIFNIKVGTPTPKYQKKYETEIVFIQDTTISAVLSNYPDSGLVSVLNFASAKHPGGEWLLGSQEQEESLARTTTMYLSLSQGAKQMYKKNEEEPKSWFYQDLIVYSPNIIILTDDKKSLSAENRKSISLISVPAVNVRAVRENAKKKRKNMAQIQQQIDNTMLSRCAAILKIAAKYETEILFLGAFGYGDNTHYVAWTFRKLLNKEFDGVFKKVIFAIPDDKNFNIFLNV